MPEFSTISITVTIFFRRELDKKITPYVFQPFFRTPVNAVYIINRAFTQNYSFGGFCFVRLANFDTEKKQLISISAAGARKLFLIQFLLKLARLRIERIAQTVAQKVQGEKRQSHRHAGKNQLPRVNGDVFNAVRGETSPRSVRRLHAET
jgi:hypothetical protein